MSKINLMIDEENELTFQVQIEGTRPGTAKCRLMLESNSMSLAFEGQSSNDEVSVTLPPLDHILKEGVYDMTLEVVVDDRFFEPLKLQGEFEKRLKVTAESVKVKTKSKVKTTASLVEVKKKNSKNNNITVARKNRRTPIVETKKNNVVTDKDIMNLIRKLTEK
jgi:hypothetical protein